MKKILSILTLLVAFAMQGVAEDTWTVAGTAAALNGTASWDPSNPVNDMTSTDGVNYTLTVTGCTLEKGTPYAFKVAKNHAWDEAYPSQNKTFTVGETAVYTVVYSFNADTKVVGVEPAKTGEAGEITHTYTVAGEPTSFFGGTDTWDATLPANEMTESSGVYTWTKNNVELDGTTIKFKVCVDHAWGTSYPSDNFVITSGSFDEYDGTGTYDVTITFDATSHDVNATVKKKVATNAEITSVVLKHEKDGWGDGLTLTAVSGETNVYSGVLDLSTVTDDFSMKLFANGSWVESSDITLADGSIPVNLTGTNYVLSNASSGYQTYTVTATWEPSPNAAKGWTLKVEGKDARVATISSVAIKGAYASDTEWANAKTLPLTGSENVYTSPIAIDMSTTLEDFVFGLVINGTFVNFTQVTIDPASASLLVDDGTDHHNILFKNSTSGYQTYTATATWTPGPDATAGWTLKVTGVDPRVLEYYLVGELTGGWPENNEDQTKDVQMTKQSNGLYTYEVASFAAEARKYEYKLRANKIWELYELPSSGNADYTFAEPGNYKLTFTANVTDAEIDGVDPYTLKLDAKKLEEVSDYYVIGDNGTEWVALGKMDYFADMKQYDYTLDKTWTGKYFAIAPASALNADGGVADWSKVLRPKTDKGNYLVELRNYDDKVVTGGNNVWEKADDITQISITYYLNQQQFSLHPTSEVTISSSGYATYSHKYDYFVGTEASIVKAVNGGEAELEKLELDLYEKGIPGGTGVILKGSPSNYMIFPYEKNDNNEYVDVKGNMLIGSGNSTFNLNADEYTAYLLQTVNGQTGFQKWNGDTTTPLPAHKAFLAIPNVTAGAPAFISFGGGTTGIEAATLSQRAGQYYTLDGRRVENPTKGLYIINGKKVVIK